MGGTTRTVGSNSGLDGLGDPGDLGDRCQDLRSGETVRLTPLSGTKVKVEVLDVGPEFLTIRVENSYVWNNEKEGEGEVGEFSYGDLEKVEIFEEEDSSDRTGLIVLG